MDWLYSDVLQQTFPPDVEALLPYDGRDAQKHLITVQGVTLSEHLAHMDTARRRFLAAFQTMTREEFCRPRTLPDYTVTPAWVVHHLMQHEAEHRSQIAAVW